MLSRLALGCLRPIEEQYLASHLLQKFIARRTSQGRLISSTPILSRVILSKSRVCQIYESCLNAILANDFTTAATLVSNADPTEPHLIVFCRLVEMLAAIQAESKLSNGNRLGAATKSRRYIAQFKSAHRSATTLDTNINPLGGDSGSRRARFCNGAGST